MNTTGLKLFSEQTGVLAGKPFSLAKRNYLWDIYNSTRGNLVIRASRQVEKSTYLANRLIYEAYRTPGKQILFIAPRIDQSRLFSTTRLKPAIMNSEILRRLLWPNHRKMPVDNIAFPNGSTIYIRSAYHSADGCRGISADMLLMDEFQDAPPASLEVLQETLSHSAHPQIILAGTPKMLENALEGVFRRSTAKEWHARCPACSKDVRMDENAIGPSSLICTQCGSPIEARYGRWVARNPDSTWGDGYTINALMAPWLKYDKILEKQASYDRVRFVNEVMGMPSALGDHIITRDEIEAACEGHSMITTRNDVPAEGRNALIAGIDWGGGSVSGTVLVVGYMTNRGIFRVLRFVRWLPRVDPTQVCSEVAEICRQMGIRIIAADHRGNGSVYNKFLLSDLRTTGHTITRYFAIQYADTFTDPRREDHLIVWSIDRTACIGALFTRIKKKFTKFPRAEACSSFLDEFVVELFVFDDAMRKGRYTKPETERDDALHATVYAETVAIRLASGF